MHCISLLRIVLSLSIAIASGCGGDDEGAPNASAADLLKRRNSEDMERQMCSGLEHDAEQRKWLAESYDGLKIQQKMSAIQAVCCAGEKGDFEEFHALILAAIDEPYLSQSAQLCLLRYDIPELQEIILKRIDKEREFGIYFPFIASYLQRYGMDQFDDLLESKLDSPLHDEQKSEIALALVRHADGAWQSKGIQQLKKYLGPPTRLYERAPRLTHDIFEALIEARCSSCNSLGKVATEVSARGREPAQSAAQKYLDAYGL